MATDELTKIPVFSTLMPLFAATVCLGHPGLYGIASNVCMVPVLGFDFAYLLAYRPAHSCAGCGSHPC